MTRILTLLLPLLFLISCGRTYYITRHAEKAQTSSSASMSSPGDPPLSQDGRDRAEALKKLLQGKKIRYIFSTNTARSLSTVQPLSDAIGVKPEIYKTPDTSFIQRLKGLKGNTLIVGHSNTIDDIANGLSNEVRVGDLPDSQYDNLFVVKYRGNKPKFQLRKYGKLSE